MMTPCYPCRDPSCSETKQNKTAHGCCSFAFFQQGISHRSVSSLATKPAACGSPTEGDGVRNTQSSAHFLQAGLHLKWKKNPAAAVIP